jgi:hypothetical protein
MTQSGPSERPFITIEVDATPVFHAIEQAAIRERQIARDDMVGRLDVILSEFANILAAYVTYKSATVAAIQGPRGSPMKYDYDAHMEFCARIGSAYDPYPLDPTPPEQPQGFEPGPPVWLAFGVWCLIAVAAGAAMAFGLR